MLDSFWQTLILNAIVLAAAAAGCWLLKRIWEENPGYKYNDPGAGAYGSILVCYYLGGLYIGYHSNSTLIGLAFSHHQVLKDLSLLFFYLIDIVPDGSFTCRWRAK